jgi:hypothetical protein
MSECDASADPPDDLVGRHAICRPKVVAELTETAWFGGERLGPGAQGGEAARARRPCSVLSTDAIEHGNDGRPEVKVFRGADDVERRAHERALDDAPLGDRSIEVGRPEAGEPRPEPDVGRCRLLGLEATDPFRGRHDVEVGAFQEQLPGEGRAVQLSLAEVRVRGASRHEIVALISAA